MCSVQENLWQVSCSQEIVAWNLTMKLQPQKHEVWLFPPSIMKKGDNDCCRLIFAHWNSVCLCSGRKSFSVGQKCWWEIDLWPCKSLGFHLQFQSSCVKWHFTNHTGSYRFTFSHQTWEWDFLPHQKQSQGPEWKQRKLLGILQKPGGGGKPSEFNNAALQISVPHPRFKESLTYIYIYIYIYIHPRYSSIFPAGLAYKHKDTSILPNKTISVKLPWRARKRNQPKTCELNIKEKRNAFLTDLGTKAGVGQNVWLLILVGPNNHTHTHTR